MFTCILALSVTYFGSFARRALVGSRTPMIWCLSNARSGDLHFGTSFVALRALVREIIPNTIHTYPPTYIHDPSRISIDCLTPASRLRRSASVWIKIPIPTTRCEHQIWAIVHFLECILAWSLTSPSCPAFPYVCDQVKGQFSRKIEVFQPCDNRTKFRKHKVRNGYSP